MRKVGIKLGLAAAVMGVGVAGKAEADPRDIPAPINTPVETVQPEPPTNVTPGNVTVTPTGSITVTAGQSAITLNSSNDVTNNGGTALGLISVDADNTTGIRIVGGFSGNILNTGPISLTEAYGTSDTDNDGDLDTPWAQGTGRHGIFLQAGAAHAGNITSSGAITVEGNNSGAIRLDALLNGDITNTGNVSTIGDSSTAFSVNGGLGAGVNGDVILSNGLINVRGVGARGLLVNAPITGELSLGGTWNVTAYHSQVRPLTAAQETALDADDILQSGSAVEIHYSIGSGITVRGQGVEDDADDDGDGITEAGGDTDDDANGTVSGLTGVPTMVITPDASANLVIGATANGYGIYNRGNISAQGVYDTFTGTAIRIEGNAGRTVTTANGILNDGVIASSAFEADAWGVIVGAGASVPDFTNRRSFNVNTTADAATDAIGLLINSGGTLNTFNNSGTFQAQAFGELANAFAVVDQSNTLNTITNRGTIRAVTIPTDDDPDDDVVPVATGDAVAIDVSASSIDILLQQLPDVVFTDQDATDDDVNSRPQIRIEGDVRFGSGNDTFNLLAGAMLGDVSFGAGNDLFTINNGAAFLGRISDTGSLIIDVVDGDLAIDGGTSNITSATFRADSVLSVLLSTDLPETTHLISSGTITFENGAVVNALIPEGLPDTGSSIFLTANGGLIGGNFVERTIVGAGAPWIYNLAIAIASSDPNSLEALYTLKTAAELGLNVNEEEAFQPILAALRQDSTASTAFTLLETQDAFETAYDDLLPSFSQGATELAATAVQQSQSAATNRLAATRLRDVDQTSVWAQEIGYGLTREPLTNGVEFRGYGFGIAGGIDGPLDNGALFGLAVSFITSQVEEPGRPDGEIAASFGQANAYLGTALGPFDLDFVGGLGLGRMSSRRVIEIGSTFQTTTEADWWAYEGHGAARASLPLALTDWLIFTPQVALTYMALNEQGYEEEGGGAAFNVEADSALTQRLWGDAGIEISGRWRLRGEGQLAPRLYLGYRTNVLSEDQERTFRFAGGSDFTLVDPSAGESAPLVGIGIDATNGFSTFSLSYEGELGDEIERHSLNAAIRFRF